MPDALLGQIIAALSDTPGLTAREIAARLGIDKSRVNSALYSRPDIFYRGAESRPRWWLQSLPARQPLPVVPASTPAPPLSPAPVAGDGGHLVPQAGLFHWQQHALMEWEGSDFRGVVEAVTGSGKTRVGMAAAQRHLSDGWKVAVVVPSRPLLDQWVAQIRERMPDARVGCLGDGHHDSLAHCDLLVAVVNSAAHHDMGLAAGQKGLLIADECHRYAGESFRLALKDAFEHRLGLTATYERDGGEHESVLTPYFGGVVFSYGYAEAVDDGVIAPFRVALIPVQFTRDELLQYEEHSKSMRRARSALLHLGAPDSPYRDFIQFVNHMSTLSTPDDHKPARTYLKALRRRRDLLASTRGKYDSLRSLSHAVVQASRTIVFTETVDSAEDCADLLVAEGITARAIHGQMKGDERASCLGQFAEGWLECLVAPRVLDEGVDVPEADLGVIFAASRQRRQMVQRMGRVLRRKQDGRAARFAILFVEGTAEDPDQSAHETFLTEILYVADEIKRFDLEADSNEVAAFLAP